MNRSRPWWILVALVVLLAFIVAVFNIGACLTAYATSWRLGGGERASVGVIRVEGTILSGRAPGGRASGTVYSEQMVNIIEKATNNPAIRAVVLRVESPGGSVVGSNEIYQALLKLNKPLIVSMGDMAASGGYYISCAADKIVVNPATLTGSIGVIAEMPNISEMMNKIGLDVTVIKSGKLKDEGSPFRAMTDEEKAVWQAIIDEAYGQFVGIVAKGRNLPEAKVRELADGRVYTGQQAIKLGLADQEGNLPDAIALAGQMAKLGDRPRVIELYTPPSFLESLLMSLPDSVLSIRDVTKAVGIDPNRPVLEYLYRG